MREIARNSGAVMLAAAMSKILSAAGLATIAIAFLQPALAQPQDDPSDGIPSLLDLAELSSNEDPSGFAYVIPAETAAIPALSERLESERDSARARFETDRADFAREMPGSSLVDHFALQKRWETMGRSGRLLSLGASIYVYEGGAHGNTAFDALLWDSELDGQIDFISLFTDRYAALAHLDRAFCARLRAMQAERFGDIEIDGPWAECPVLHEQAIVPAGAAGEPMTAIQVLVPPYVAGPYSMGVFEIAIPVDAALIDMLKPEYRAAFAVAAGS